MTNTQTSTQPGVPYRGLRIHLPARTRHITHGVIARTCAWVVEEQHVGILRGLDVHDRYLLDLGDRGLIAAPSRDMRWFSLGLTLAIDPDAGSGSPPTTLERLSTPELLALFGAEPAEDVDYAALVELQNDSTLLTLTDVADELHLSRDNLGRCWRATQHYLLGTCHDWPPSIELLRGDLGPARKIRNGPRPVTSYPFHASLLPPPSLPGCIEPRWTLGHIRRWAMSVARMSLNAQQVWPLGPGAAALPARRGWS